MRVRKRGVLVKISFKMKREFLPRQQVRQRHDGLSGAAATAGGRAAAEEAGGAAEGECKPVALNYPHRSLNSSAYFKPILVF